MTENSDLTHTRSVGQSVAGRASGWGGPSHLYNKQLTTANPDTLEVQDLLAFFT